MKSMRNSVSLLWVLSGLAGWSGAQAAVVFQDDFSGNSAAHWSFSGENLGTWAAADQKLQSTTVSGTAHNPAAPGFATINGLGTAAHFKIEADVQVIGAGPGRQASGDFGHVGFFWGKSGTDYSMGYLRTHTDQTTAWRNPYQGSELLMNVGSVTNAVDVNGVSYHLAYEVDYVAQLLTVTLGSTSHVFSGQDFGIANAAGGIGGALGVISWGERVSYDNVVVTDFTAAGQSLPEPGSVALVLCALGLAGAARRRLSSASP